MARPKRPLTAAAVRKLASPAKRSVASAGQTTTIHSTFVSFDDRGSPSAQARIERVASSGGRSTWRIDVETAASIVPAPEWTPRAERRVLKAAERRKVRRLALPQPFRPEFAELRGLPRRTKPPSAPRVEYKGERLDPLIVFPPDKRFVYQDNAYPWRCAGRVTSNGKTGSGVLVGPRHVLTASHVIDWSSPQLTFRANQFDSTSSGVAFATLIWSYEKISSVNTDNVEADYVVCVMDTFLGNSLGWMGSREYYDDWDGGHYWSNIGYTPSLGGGDRPVFQNDFALEEEDGGDQMAMTSTTVDLTPGHSGGPVFGWWSPGPYVVGVVSAGGQGKNWISGGEDMVDLVKIARATSP